MPRVIEGNSFPILGPVVLLPRSATAIVVAAAAADGTIPAQQGGDGLVDDVVATGIAHRSGLEGGGRRLISRAREVSMMVEDGWGRKTPFASWVESSVARRI